jgi:hypothetical protein
MRLFEMHYFLNVELGRMRILNGEKVIIRKISEFGRRN